MKKTVFIVFLLISNFGCSSKEKATEEKQAIREKLSLSLPTIRKCYEAEIKTDPSLKGKVVADFVINPQGVVSSAVVVSTTINNKKMEDCILSEIKKINFDNNSGTEIQVKFPFVFQPTQ